MEELQQVLDLKTIITLIVSVLGSYYALREKISELRSITRENTVQSQRNQIVVEKLYEENKAQSIRLEEINTCVESFEKRLDKVENKLDANQISATN